MSDDKSHADPEAPKLVHRVRGWLKGWRRGGDDSLRESLEELLQEHDGGSDTPVESEERVLLRNVLKVGELRVDDVMVPRADIIAVDSTATLDEVMDLFVQAQHTRLPVYRETLDDVTGMLHIKDLLEFWDGKKPFTMAPVIRKVLFVPPSMSVLDLLLQMRSTRVHMALVVDEFGGIDGLATFEDLVEQIVGEIEDEHDEVEGPLLVERADGTLEADARYPVEDLERRVGVALLDEEREEYVETLGGLIFSLLGRVPRRGELIEHPCGLAFEVIDADPRRVKRLRIRNLDAVRRVEPDTKST